MNDEESDTRQQYDISRAEAGLCSTSVFVSLECELREDFAPFLCDGSVRHTLEAQCTNGRLPTKSLCVSMLALAPCLIMGESVGWAVGTKMFVNGMRGMQEITSITCEKSLAKP